MSGAINPQLTANEIMEVPCLACEAAVGHRCCDATTGTTMMGFHTCRLELREKYPVVAHTEENEKQELSAEDKSMIVHYAFVIMAGSISAKSEALMGKHLTPTEVQRFFCAMAVKEAKADGMLK